MSQLSLLGNRNKLKEAKIRIACLVLDNAIEEAKIVIAENSR